MSGYTKGPWYTTRRHEVGTRIDSDEQSDCMINLIADVYGDNKDADLALISAAPELLEALEELLSLTDDPANDADPEESTFAFARKAIKKAKGE